MDKTIDNWTRRLFYLGIAVVMILGLLLAPAITSQANAAEVSAKWSKVATPYTDDWTVAPYSDIVVAASIPGGSVIYVVGSGFDDNDMNASYGPRLWKSEDSGVTWDDLADKVWDADSLPVGFNSSTSYFNYVACALDDPDFMAVAIVTNNAAAVPVGDYCNATQAVVISDDGGDNFYWTRDISDSAANSILNCVFDMKISNEDSSGKYNIALGGVGAKNGTCPTGLVYRYETGGLVGGGWADASAYDGWDNINDDPGGATDITSRAVTKVAFAPSWLADKTVLAVSHTNVTGGIGATYLQSGSWGNTKVWNLKAGFEAAVQVASDPSMWSAFRGAAAGLALPTDYEGRHANTRYAWVYVDRYDDGGVIYKVENGAVSAVTQQITGNPYLASLSYLGSIDSGKAIAGSFGNGAGAPTDCCEGVQVYRNDGITEMDICCEHWSDACKPPTGAMRAMAAYVLPNKAYAFVSGVGGPFDESAFSFSLDDGDTWNQLGLVDTYINYLSDVAKSPNCNKTWVVSVNDLQSGSPLGSAANFAVLAGEAVTNVPTSAITGDVGLSPAAGSNYAGLTVAEVTGTIYAVDASGPAGAAGNNPVLTLAAKNALTAAYLDLFGLTPDDLIAGGELDGLTLTPGVYRDDGAPASLTNSGLLELDAEGDPDAVFIFQSASTLIAEVGSEVSLINDAQACNVFWQVGSSATLKTNSTFVGTILALTSITLENGANVDGRVLAQNGAVTLDTNTITNSCAAAPWAAACSCDSVWLKADPLPEASEYSGAWIREWNGMLTSNREYNSGDTPEMGLLRLAPEETEEALTVYLVDRGTDKVYYDSTEGLGCWEEGSSTVDEISDLAVQDEATIYAVGFNADVAVSDDHGSAASWSDTMDSKVDDGHTIAVLGEGNVLVGGADGKVSYSDSDLATFLDGEASFTKLEDGLGAGNVHVAFDSYFDTNSVVYAAVSNPWYNTADNGIYRWVIDESSSWKDLGDCVGAATPYAAQLGYDTCDEVQVGYYGIVLSNAEGNPETDAITGGVLYAAFYDDDGNVTGVARCLNPAEEVACGGQSWDYLIQGMADDAALTLEPSSLKICGCLTPDTNARLFAIDDDWYYDYFAIDEDSDVGRLWTYEDCFAKAAPVIISPADNAVVDADPCYCWNDAFTLKWERQCDACSYNLQISRDADFTEVVLDISGRDKDTCLENDYEPSSGTSPSYVVKNQELGTGSCGTTFYWRVRSADAETDEIIHSPWSDVRSFTVAVGAGAALTLTNPSNGAIGVAVTGIPFTWDAVPDATGYEFSMVNAATDADVVSATPVSGTTYTYTGTLSYNTSYYWTVKALKDSTPFGAATATFTTGAEGAVPVPPTTPAWVWVVIAIGAVLVIVTLVLIFRTRRV